MRQDEVSLEHERVKPAHCMIPVLVREASLECRVEQPSERVALWARQPAGRHDAYAWRTGHVASRRGRGPVAPAALTKEVRTGGRYSDGVTSNDSVRNKASLLTGVGAVGGTRVGAEGALGASDPCGERVERCFGSR